MKRRILTLISVGNLSIPRLFRISLSLFAPLINLTPLSTRHTLICISSKLKNRKYCCLCLKRNTRHKAYGISNFTLSNELLKVFIVVNFVYKMHFYSYGGFHSAATCPESKCSFREPMRAILLSASLIFKSL